MLRPRLPRRPPLPRPPRRHNSTSTNAGDPRIRQHARRLIHEYDTLRTTYHAPKNPVVLCHGLLGFDTLRLAGDLVPGIEYWRGIADVLRGHGVHVLTCAVPPSASIEERAEVLARVVAERLPGAAVNLIGGIDARYMISKLRPTGFKVHTLTTITTPHRGSPVADVLLSPRSPVSVLLGRTSALQQRLRLSTGAFPQLTTKYMKDVFNPAVPDDPAVRYYSYGACFEPEWYSVFRLSHRLVREREGENDGLVSVESAMWGEYEGTVVGASHLEVINWYNRMEWAVAGMRERVLGERGKGRGFNAVAFYCDVVERLAERGF